MFQFLQISDSTNSLLEIRATCKSMPYTHFGLYSRNLELREIEPSIKFITRFIDLADNTVIIIEFDIIFVYESIRLDTLTCYFDLVEPHQVEIQESHLFFT